MDDAQAPNVPGYDVGRLLGRGGSADVWLAREQRSGRQYALKCFRAGGGTGDGDGTSRTGGAPTDEDVRREIRILSVLDHQHLIRAHHAVRTAAPMGGPALTMDYAAGGSLAQLLAARGRLSVGETVTVLTPIAQALGYLHGKGFTHSDVAPGNILFTGQGKPMLSDLGVARMLGDPGTAGAGTAGFTDPTPVDAVRAGLQPERDVYSAAALGWYCLTGEAPGRTSHRPPLSLLVRGVPTDLAVALEAGLNEDRRLRPNALAFAAAIYRSAEPQPVDLSTAVHPTVLPELLTRRAAPAAGKGGRLRAKVQGLRRRAATARWDGRPAAAPGRGLARELPAGVPRKMPAPHGKHAGPHPPGRGRQLLLRTLLPAAAAVTAGVWMLLGPAGQELWSGHAVARPEAPTAAVPPAAAAPEPPAAGGKGDTAALAAARERANAADPVTAVRGLSVMRDTAFSTGDLDLLAAVNAPGSSAAAADGRIAGQMAGSAQRLAGFTTLLSDVAPEGTQSAAKAVVRLTSSTSGYRTLDAGGKELAEGPPGPARPLRLVLESVDGRWMISDILPGE